MTSSLLDVARGAQRPRVWTRPKGRLDLADAEECADLAAGYGLTPDEWQAWVIKGWLARSRSTGRLAASRCGLAVPRQNGKNAILEAVELYKMVALGRRVLHTAHEVKTARKAFLRLCSFFENARQYPELTALVRDIRKTNGQEAIYLTNGGSVEFIARSKGSGRGFTVDDLVCDEAQELNDDALAALYPTISAAPSGDPQLILTGTPPSPMMSGEVFTRFREAGVEGKDARLCWDEWSAANDADADSPVAWASVNPALGIRLGLDVIRDERAAMDVETFGRERLGMWADAGGHRAALPIGAWVDLADADAERGTEVSFGLDVAEDRSGWLAVAWRRTDGIPQVMLAEPDAFPAFRVGEVCAEKVTRWGGSVVPPRAFADELERAGVRVTAMKAGEFSAACGAFADAVTGGQIRHGNQSALNAAVRAARWRSAGSTGERAFQLKDCPEVGPLAAATRALHGLNAGVDAAANVW